MPDILPLIVRLLCWPLIVLAVFATAKLLTMKRGGL